MSRYNDAVVVSNDRSRKTVYRIPKDWSTRDRKQSRQTYSDEQDAVVVEHADGSKQRYDYGSARPPRWHQSPARRSSRYELEDTKDTYDDHKSRPARSPSPVSRRESSKAEKRAHRKSVVANTQPRRSRAKSIQTESDDTEPEPVIVERKPRRNPEKPSTGESRRKRTKSPSRPQSTRLTHRPAAPAVAAAPPPPPPPPPPYSPYAQQQQYPPPQAAYPYNGNNGYYPVAAQAQGGSRLGRIGRNLGNAAVFGVGFTAGADLINSIF